MGYTNSRVIIRWWNPVTNKICLTTSVRFNEEHFSNTDKNKAPGCISTTDTVLSSERLTYESINITDHPFLNSEPSEFLVTLPKKVLLWV